MQTITPIKMLGMKPTPQGYAPEAGYLGRVMASMPDFSLPWKPMTWERLSPWSTPS